MRFATGPSARRPRSGPGPLAVAVAVALICAGCALTGSTALPDLRDIDEVQTAKGPPQPLVNDAAAPTASSDTAEDRSVDTEDPEVLQARAREDRRRAGQPTIAGLDSGDPFTCRLDGGLLGWDDVDADRYYVFFTIDGYESYLGPIADVEIVPTRADSYRVEHWRTGEVTNATCPGEGVPTLRCSYDDGVLSWPETGAEVYYVFAIEDGAEQHLGPVEDTELEVDEADSYRVEHWMTGLPTDTTCSR